MTGEGDKATRWRPGQFSLKSLLLWSVVVGLAVGWWIDRNHLSELKLQIKDERSKREKAEVDVEVLRGQLNDIYMRVDDSTQQDIHANWRQRLRR